MLSIIIDQNSSKIIEIFSIIIDNKTIVVRIVVLFLGTFWETFCKLSFTRTYLAQHKPSARARASLNHRTPDRTNERTNERLKQTANVQIKHSNECSELRADKFEKAALVFIHIRNDFVRVNAWGAS